MGLEGDMVSSSRTMTFMERSSYSEAIELNQNFVTGIWFNNSYLDQRLQWQATIMRTDLGSSSGVLYGDGQWGAQARVTGLPLYEDEGRYLMHLGVSGGWRNGTNNLSTSSYRTFDLRARPELRDDDPASGGSTSSQLVPNANDSRMVDTGSIAASDDFLMGTEFLLISGAFSLQGEYGWNRVENAVGIAPTGFTLNPRLTPNQNYTFNGGYVQAAYTLTGENRSYDRSIGSLAREYFGKSGPYENAWLVRDENGNLGGGIGAWELAVRYSYVNLNDGAGLLPHPGRRNGRPERGPELVSEQKHECHVRLGLRPSL